MNRKHYMSMLNESLKNLRHDERQDILQDFEEHFDVGIEEGKTEEEIAASLGSPQQIAKELMADYFIHKAEVSFTAGNMIRAAWASVSLGIFNFAIVLGPFLALIALVFGGWMIGISFLTAPILVLINLVIYPASFHFFDFFLSITLSGLGILISIGMMYVTRMMFKGFVKYLRFNIKLVKGGLQHE